MFASIREGNLHGGHPMRTTMGLLTAVLVLAACSGASRSVWASALPLDGGYVISASYRRGEPVAAPSREVLERDFPATATHFGPIAQAAYARPLTVGGRRIGAFGLVFGYPEYAVEFFVAAGEREAETKTFV